MKKTGMSRKIDDLGRVVIPAEMRKGFGLKDGDYLEISVEQDQIILSKRHDICVFCSSPADLKEFKEQMICATCIRELTGEGDVQPWEPFSAE
jgi:AbrB family transcriptional regulator, transcriptional pleiotropic regulator of transition state genes